MHSAAAANMRHQRPLSPFAIQTIFYCTIIATSVLLLPCRAFSILGAAAPFSVRHGNHTPRQHLPPPLLSSSSSSQGDYDYSSDNDADPDEVVTKDMFLRAMLETGEEIRIRKKGQKSGSAGGATNNKQKQSEYKVMDNRDILPFAVQLQTPDPYVHPEIKRQKAQKAKKRRDAVEEQIASRLYYMDHGGSSSSSSGKDNTKTLLGEFNLDKHTTTGDILLVGGHEYKVMRHRCQYKYAGGQRFVMLRKILEVKEVGRLHAESMLMKQFAQTGDGSDDNNNNNTMDSSETFI